MLEIDKKIIDLADKLVRAYFSSPLEKIEHVVGKGEVNQVYIVKTANGEAVLRLNDVSEFERFKKEQWCIKTAIAKGVPSSEVLNIGKNGAFAYMFIGFINGRNGNEISASTDMWRILGKYLRLIHNTPTRGFGETLDDIISNNREKWQRYLEYNSKSLTNDDILIQMGVLDRPSLRTVKKIFQQLKSKTFTFGLNHGDYSLANVIVDEHNLMHIIDWGSAQAHVVPHYDLAIILDESLAENSEEFVALLDGYGLSRSDYEVIKPDIINLQLLEAIDKLRWALDKAPDRVKHYTDQTKKFLNKVA